MGQFSWYFADKKQRLINGEWRDSYLLVPPEFQNEYGKAIHETHYEGYGVFGGYDVYELVARWNRSMIPEIIGKMLVGSGYANRAKKTSNSSLNIITASWLCVTSGMMKDGSES